MLATALIYYLEKYKKPNEYYNTNKMYREIISKTLCTSCRGKLLREVIIYGLTRERTWVRGKRGECSQHYPYLLRIHIYIVGGNTCSNSRCSHTL